MESGKKNYLKGFLDLMRTLASIFTLLLAFCIYRQVTLPDSNFNLWKGKNENSRQQAQLLIDLFKEDDVFKLKNGYDIIMATQGALDTTINLEAIDSIFRNRVYEKEKSNLVDKYTNLLIRKTEIKNKYKSYEGVGDFTIGQSEIPPDISFLESFINKQLKELEIELAAYDVDVKSIRYYKEYHDLIK